MVGLNYLQLPEYDLKSNRFTIAFVSFLACIAFFSTVELLSWSKETQAKEQMFEERVMQLEQEVRDIKQKRYMEKLESTQSNGTLN